MKKTQLILAIVLSLAMILTLSACKTTVAVSAEAKNGSVAGVGSYYAGDSVTLTATPDEGYEFAGWYNGNEKVSDENPYTFTVNGNITLKALFVRIVRYSLTVTAGGNGKISGSASGEYEAGEKISVTATPDEGFLFAGWFRGEEKVSDSATYEFVMPAEAVALTAKFEVKPAEKFSVVFYDYAGKVISAQEILYGESAEEPDSRLTAHAYSCFEFKGWDKDFENVTENLEIRPVYDYIPASDEHFEFTAVEENGEVVGYTIHFLSGMNPAEDGLFAFPEEHEGKPVIGFDAALNLVGWRKSGVRYSEMNLSLYIPDSFRSFGEDTFTSCVLKRIIIGKGLEKIDEKAMWKSVRVYEWLVAEDNPNFSADSTGLYNKDKTTLIHVGDTSVESYTIVAGVKNTYPYLFWNMYVRTVTIDADLESIGRAAFARSSLTNFVVNGSVKRLEDGTGGDTGEEGVFSLCSNLMSISIPGIEYVGRSAFADCNWLESITLDTTLKEIGRDAFVSCLNLIQIAYKDGATVNTAGNILIENNAVIVKNGSEILLEDGVTKGDLFLAYAAGIDEESYTVPETVREFALFAFAYSKVSEVIIPEGVTVIPGGMFYSAYVKKVSLPESVKILDEVSGSMGATNIIGSIGVFTNSSLETLEIAEGNALEKIGTCAFYGTSLTSFTVPSTVTYFGESVFGGCYSLSEVNVDEGSTILKSIGGVLYNFDLTELIVFPAASAITEYVAPETLVKARTEAFAYARAESVTFNEGFLELGERAFFLSGVKKIVFPESFTTLYATALNSFMCDTLTLEFRSATIPEVKGEDTEEVIRVAYAESITIRVPEEAFDAYIVWLDSVTENYSGYLDTTGYVNLSTFEFYTGDGETPYQTIESKRLMSYPVFEWTGEGTKYFTGWFFDNGTWEEELITPCRREDNKTYKLYARWSDTARKDGTTEWWAYDIRVNQSLTITLKYDQPTVYFNVKLDKRYTGYLFILAYVNGKQQGQAQFIGEEIPENDIVKISLDFSQFMASTDVRSVEVRFDTWGTAASTSLDFQEPKSQEIPRIGLCLIDLSKRILVK